MRPTQPAGHSITPAAPKTSSVNNAWQLGTILKAVVLGASADGAVRLQIGARVVTAQSALPLQTGQALQLQVAETGRTVLLRTLSDSRHMEPVREGIRQNLPRQLPQTPLLAAALGLIKSGNQLPAGLAAAAARVVSAMHDPAALTQGRSLQQAVLNSGIFLEPQLIRMLKTATGQQGVSLSRDWKAALLVFRERLVQQHARLSAGAGQPTRPTANPVSNGSNASPRQFSSGGPPTPANAGAVPSTTPVAVYSTTASLPGPATRPSVEGLPAAVAAKAESPITPATAATPRADGATTRPGMQQGASDVPAPMRHALPTAQPPSRPGTPVTEPLTLVSELLAKTDGALARVRLNQLASITPDQASRLVWLLELPVRHADNTAEVVTMRIEQDDKGSETNTKSAWNADLAFDLGIKGQLRARVALRAGRVSVSFRADADQTRAEVQGKLPELENAMKKKKLDVATLSAGTGRPSAQPASPASLLETQA